MSKSLVVIFKFESKEHDQDKQDLCHFLTLSQDFIEIGDCAFVSKLDVVNTILQAKKHTEPYKDKLLHFKLLHVSETSDMFQVFE